METNKTKKYKVIFPTEKDKDALLYSVEKAGEMDETKEPQMIYLGTKEEVSRLSLKELKAGYKQFITYTMKQFIVGIYNREFPIDNPTRENDFLDANMFYLSTKSLFYDIIYYSKAKAFKDNEFLKLVKENLKLGESMAELEFYCYDEFYDLFFSYDRTKHKIVERFKN